MLVAGLDAERLGPGTQFDGPRRDRVALFPGPPPGLRLGLLNGVHLGLGRLPLTEELGVRDALRARCITSGSPVSCATFSTTTRLGRSPLYGWRIPITSTVVPSYVSTVTGRRVEIRYPSVWVNRSVDRTRTRSTPYE